MDPYLYQYLVGGLIFLAGLAYAGRQGYIGFSGRGARNLVLMLGGLALFMTVQGYLQYAPMDTAEPVAYSGGGEMDAEGIASRTMGHPIDYAVMACYMAAILVIGTWFARRNTGTKDFFFGGQRFSWWLIAFSLVATLVGSYSFVKLYGATTASSEPGS